MIDALINSPSVAPAVRHFRHIESAADDGRIPTLPPVPPHPEALAGRWPPRVGRSSRSASQRRRTTEPPNHRTAEPPNCTRQAAHHYNESHGIDADEETNREAAGHRYSRVGGRPRLGSRPAHYICMCRRNANGLQRFVKRRRRLGRRPPPPSPCVARRGKWPSKRARGPK